MSDETLSPEEITILAKLNESFQEIHADDRSTVAKMLLTSELANGLHSLDDKIVIPVLGFLLRQYLERHPDGLAADESFASLIYYLRGVSDDMLHESQHGNRILKSGNRMNMLSNLSVPQMEAITAWIDVSRRWTCCRRFQFDLEEAKAAWSAYAVSYKSRMKE